MKIDIKSIVNTLSSGVSEIKSTSGTVNIREALGEKVEEKTQQEIQQEEIAEEELQAEEITDEEPEVVNMEVPIEESDEADEETYGENDVDDIEVDDEVCEEDEAFDDETDEEELPTEPEPEQEECEVGEEDEQQAEDFPEEEQQADEESENESHDNESAETEKPEKQPSPIKDKLIAWGRSYGWLTGIAASFVILIAFMVIYTTMTPRQISVTINGENYKFTTKAYTVEEFLETENIEFCEEDYISVSLTAFIQEGIEFELRHATDFTVTADGKTKKYKTLDNTVQQALDDVGIEVGKNDIVKPAPKTMLSKDLKIVVKRVVIKKEVIEEEIEFETIEKDDVTLNEGTTKVVTKGKPGKAKVTYEIKYIDGKEASKKEIDRKTITAAVDEVIANGTRVNYNGKTYSKKLEVKAYAYTGGGTTASGTRARVGEIAVDPSVIPLGTNVYIEGVGPRRAEDTGGNIKGNTIDIYMDTQSECINWGMRYVTIYIE